MSDRIETQGHTKGPWVIGNDGKPLFGYWHIRQDPEDWNGKGYQVICSLTASNLGSPAGDMFKANARLISAAPDMLEALKAALVSQEFELNQRSAGIDRFEGAPIAKMFEFRKQKLLVEIAATKAAIAKAEVIK